jgi:divalent metal cation (Fe/Co/Zn/Cd) transporter
VSVPIPTRRQAVVIAALTNATLVIGAIALAVLTGSVAALAQATHAAAELLAAITAAISSRAPGEPPSRAGLRAGVAEGVLVVLAGLVAAFASWQRFGDSVAHPVVACIGLAALALAGQLVASRTRRSARQYRSHQLAAEAETLRSATRSALLASACCGVVALTGYPQPDALGGFVIAALVIRRGVELAVATLPGREPREHRDVATVAALLGAGPSEVIGYGAIRSRSAAGVRRVDVDVVIEPDTSAVRQLELVRQLETEIREALGAVRVTVHLRKPAPPVPRRRDTRRSTGS